MRLWGHEEVEQGNDEEKVAIISDDDNNDLESATFEETPKTESPGDAKLRLEATSLIWRRTAAAKSVGHQ